MSKTGKMYQRSASLLAIAFIATAKLPLELRAQDSPGAGKQGVTSGVASSKSAAQDGVLEPYLLQAGDEIQIRVYNIPELDQTVRIRPDGRISLLLLNEVEAAGRTPEELSRSLSSSYAEFFRTPRVTTIVKTFTNREVFVGGEVTQPRIVPLSGKMSATAAIFYAGGFKNTAKTREVIILHKMPNGAAEIKRLNVEAVLTKGGSDVQLQPFDVVFVPKSRIAKLDQFVDQYMKQLMPIATSLGFSYILGGQGFAISIP